MKKDNLLSAVCLVGILALCFPLVARADSSWVWITKTRPYDVLPFVVVGTLLIETLSIWLIPHTRRLSKVFWVVCLGNGLSYAAPYFFQLFNPVYSFQKALNTHFYNVSISFLIVTLVIEGPIEYYMLEKETDQPKKLLWAVILSNVVTTVGVAITERLLCRGFWV